MVLGRARVPLVPLSRSKICPRFSACGMLLALLTTFSATSLAAEGDRTNENQSSKAGPPAHPEQGFSTALASVIRCPQDRDVLDSGQESFCAGRDSAAGRVCVLRATDHAAAAALQRPALRREGPPRLLPRKSCERREQDEALTEMSGGRVAHSSRSLA